MAQKGLLSQPFGELKPTEPSLRDRIAFGVGGLLSHIGGDNYAQGDLARKVGGLLDFIPVVGDAIGFDDAKRDFQAGNYGMAAAGLGLTAAGMVPGAGDAVASGVKKLFRATNSQYSKMGNRAGFRWWTPDREWASNYGDNIIEQDFGDLNLLDLPLDGPEVKRALEDAGIDVDDIRFTQEIDEFSDPLDLEVQQILTDAYDGPALSERLKRAGYHGVRHPDNLAGRIGDAIAIIGWD